MHTPSVIKSLDFWKARRAEYAKVMSDSPDEFLKEMATDALFYANSRITALESILIREGYDFSNGD